MPRSTFLAFVCAAAACAGGDTPLDSDADADTDVSGSVCFGDDSVPCSACLATSCCDDFGPCMADDACYPGYSCLLRCDGTFAECADSCAVSGNARWTALAACGQDECAAAGCAP